MFSNRLIVCKRNTVSHLVMNSVSLVPKRNVVFRVSVVSYDDMGQVKYSKTSGLFKVTLSKDEEVVVMSVDRHITFPLQISFNVACITPRTNEPVTLAIPEEFNQLEAQNYGESADSHETDEES
ncbi:germ cell-less protein-like 1 [Saccoglossus kowalevskii]